MTLLMDPTRTPITVDAIASHAGVGKQTIYRWWPSKSAIMIEALTESARDHVRDIDCGDLRGDLEHFIASTFRVVNSRPVAQGLRAMMAEALYDPPAAEVLREYTAQRRAALLMILQRAAARGEFPDGPDMALAVEQAFGFLWYRLLIGHAPLTRKAALSIADALLRQLAATPLPKQRTE
jgi:AcrR family transcriptional regulator